MTALTQSPNAPALRRNGVAPRARIRQMGAGLALLLLAGTAAAGDVRYTASHTTAKSPEAVLEVLSAYSKTCDKGCKYSRPNLVVVRKVSHQSTTSKYYTWTHLSNTLKDVKYFTEVKIEKKEDGHFVLRNRQLDKSDKSLIASLEDKTGLPHSPAFDGGVTVTVTESVGTKTKVTQNVTVVAGTLASLWEGRIRDGMKESVDATFQNIER